MRLLIVTQKVDKEDAVLGFFHEWILEFSKHYEKIVIIALQVGECSLPSNVEVLSLGKENKQSRVSYLTKFYSYIWGRRNEYDKVFVHMNPEYVVLGGLLWRILGKRVGLWYTHRQTGITLRIAEKLAHIIFSASSFSFRIASEKLHILGHGINVGFFECVAGKPLHTFKVTTVGRITKIKNCDILLKAVAILKESTKGDISAVFVGSPVTKDDENYFIELKQLVSKLGLEKCVEFIGSVPNYKIPQYYCDASVTVNMAPAGGIDKSVLESMAAKTPVITSNEAFKVYFDEYASDLTFKVRDEHDLALKIKNLYERNDREKIGEFLALQAKKHFNVTNIVGRITSLL